MSGITDSVDVNLSKLRETAEARESWRAAVHGVAKSQTGLSNLTTDTYCIAQGAIISYSITDSMDMNLSKLRKIEDREAWHAAVHEVTQSWTRLSD